MLGYQEKETETACNLPTLISISFSGKVFSEVLQKLCRFFFSNTNLLNLFSNLDSILTKHLMNNTYQKLSNINIQ